MIRPRVQYRVRKRRDDKYVAEVKGLFFWRSCFIRETGFFDEAVPQEYDTKETALLAVDAHYRDVLKHANWEGDVTYVDKP